MRMCLIHDIAESEIGDLMPEEKVSENQHRKEEERVARSLFESVPPKSRRIFLSDWKELVKRKTAEAKIGLGDR